MTNEERWLANYEALKAHVLETGHFPNKHDRLLNWYKYNAKLIKQGKLSPEREQMIHELEEMRSGERTGGCKRKGLNQHICNIDEPKSSKTVSFIVQKSKI